MQFPKKSCIFAFTILTFTLQAQNLQRATGIGGIFFKAKDHKMLANWYEQHLGFDIAKNLYFAFSWREYNGNAAAASTSLGIFSDASGYFNPSSKKIMLNIRVEKLEELLRTLKAEGVTVEDKTDHYAYGNFGWIMDADGNKIELWEPIESGFGIDEKTDAEKMNSLNKVTGISGIYLNSNNRTALIEWYTKHLGMHFNGSQHAFKCRDYVDTKINFNCNFTVLDAASKTNETLQKEFMIQFRVKNLEALLEQLKKEGISIVGQPEKNKFGNFARIMDPEGNTIELCEPALID